MTRRRQLQLRAFVSGVCATLLFAPYVAELWSRWMERRRGYPGWYA